MQPCGVCGATSVDANGHCTVCRTYRGLPQPLMQAPPSLQAPPPVRAGGRNSFVIPVVALSATLIVLVVAIVVVTIARSGSGNGATGPSPASTLVDPCVVGDWTQTSHKEVQTSPLLAGPITLTGGGVVSHLHANGTGVLDFGDNTTYSGTGTLASSGASVQIALKVTGTVSFDYRTNNGAISFSNMVSKAQNTAFTNGQAGSATPVQPNSTPSNYTCTSTTMTTTDEIITSVYRRTS